MDYCDFRFAGSYDNNNGTYNFIYLAGRNHQHTLNKFYNNRTSLSTYSLHRNNISKFKHTLITSTSTINYATFYVYRGLLIATATSYIFRPDTCFVDVFNSKLIFSNPYRIDRSTLFKLVYAFARLRKLVS